MSAVPVSLPEQLHSIGAPPLSNGDIQVLQSFCPVLPFRALPPFCSAAAACLICRAPAKGKTSTSIRNNAHVAIVLHAQR